MPTRHMDPITAEIIRYGLMSVPEQIDVNITRTAYSPLIYEYKDYAIGIVDPEGRLIVQSQGGIPLFVANALGVAVRDGHAVHGMEGIEDGDVIISNHAATLGQHLNNVVMYTPIHVGAERLGYMAVLVHWVDVGGKSVGSFIAHDNTEIFQEGTQYRSVKLLARGKPQADIYRMIEINTRFPQAVLGDLAAQLAGCLRGRDMVAELVEKYGLADVRTAIELMWQRSEAAARAAIRALPDGVYKATSFLDNDGIELDKKIAIDVVVRIEGDEMFIDLSGVSDQTLGPINSGREGGAVTASRIAFKYLVAPNEPANEGIFRPVHVIIPDGKFLSATGNAALGSYSSPLATVIDTIMKAMMTAAPGHIAAGHHGNFGVHLIYGRDPITRELYQHIETAHGGWGASLGHDGPGPYKTMAHGDTLDVPAEVQEALYPLRVVRVLFRPDSGGAGKSRGGLGVEKEIEVLAACTIRVLIDRVGCPPWGVLGGGDGAPPVTYIEKPGETPESIQKAVRELKPGDRIRIMTSGGGGYGDALERDPARVAEDVRLGYVTAKAARDIYGVILDESGAVLERETDAHRASASRHHLLAPLQRELHVHDATPAGFSVSGRN
jgi:N-methylhydantoinase B